VRSGLENLIGRLWNIPGVSEVSLTTNGSLLTRQARALKAAGLNRVTISLDSMDRARYREITRGGRIEDTFAGISAALSAGFAPIKLNAVLQRSTWMREVPDLLGYAAGNQLVLQLVTDGMKLSPANPNFVQARDAKVVLLKPVARLGGDLLDGIFRLVKVEQGAESLRLLQRVNVAALQIFNQLRFKGLGIGQMNDADRHSLGLGNERGAVAARSGNDLEAMVADLIERTAVNAIRLCRTQATGHWFYDDMAMNNGPMFSPAVFEK